MAKSTGPNMDFIEMEKKWLSHWYKTGVIKKYLNKNSKSTKYFSFLDGPITANNPMGVHHAWGRTYKDIWQKFYNLQGYRQRFQNGFDCQGLWVEVEVEKELKLKSKKDIENLVPGDKEASIAKFVELCKERVLRFSKIQTNQTIRLGNFMDWDRSYFTMSDENNYMIWFFLKKCYENGWIYKGKDSVPWCPRCETAISQHEMLTEDYKEIEHETVFFKLPVLNKDFSLVAWTTTPWTIPANVAVAVNPKFTYRVWKEEKTGEKVLFLREDSLPKREKIEEYNEDKKFLNEILEGRNWRGDKDYQGSELVGLKYQGPFDSLERVKKAKNENPKTFHSIIPAEDLVVATKGTGILHVAPGAGQEDFQLAKKENLPVIDVIHDNAEYLTGLGKFSGKNAKKHPEIIIDYLKEAENEKYLFKTMKFKHRYPACWRCKTELVWKVAKEWYIDMDKPTKNDKRTLRQRMRTVAKKINWKPEFGLDRELDWLKNMHNWLISKKNRYWGLALPIYECKKCSSFEVIGSREELKKRAVKGWGKFEGHSPHKPYIDEVFIKCQKCGELVKRVDDVGNPWLDAGIVPFSTITENNQGDSLYLKDRKKWDKWFPADFITESFPGQFKNWFYALIAMATVLEDSHPFKTVLGFATLLGEDGRPMHKSWGNAIEFNEGADKIGVDVMRWMYARQNPTENMLFGYKHADEVRRLHYLILWNVYKFFRDYKVLDKYDGSVSEPMNLTNNLDKWIVSRLHQIIKVVEEHLRSYQPKEATTQIEKFINDLSTFYIRASRDRVWVNSKDKKDKYNFYSTLQYILAKLSILLSPISPFLSEEIYTNLTKKESVHLENWPKYEKKYINLALENEIELARQAISIAHSKRKEARVRVRQPLSSLATVAPINFSQGTISMIQNQVNVQEVQHKKGDVVSAQFSTFELSDSLRQQGEARDMIRKIQEQRRAAGTAVYEEVDVYAPKWPTQFEQEIKDKALVSNLIRNKEFRVIRKK